MAKEVDSLSHNGNQKVVSLPSAWAYHYRGPGFILQDVGPYTVTGDRTWGFPGRDYVWTPTFLLLRPHSEALAIAITLDIRALLQLNKTSRLLLDLTSTSSSSCRVGGDSLILGLSLKPHALILPYMSREHLEQLADVMLASKVSTIPSCSSPGEVLAHRDTFPLWALKLKNLGKTVSPTDEPSTSIQERETIGKFAKVARQIVILGAQTPYAIACCRSYGRHVRPAIPHVPNDENILLYGGIKVIERRRNLALKTLYGIDSREPDDLSLPSL